MSWTGVEYVAQQASSAALLNTVKANLEYLHATNYAEYHHPGTGADYTSTASSGQDIDGTNFNLSITTYGESALVMAVFHGTFSCSATSSSMRAAMINADDVIAYAGRNLFFNYAVEVSSTDVGLGWIQYFIVPPGVHSFKAIWGIYGGGTATLYAASRPYMAVWEL